MMRSLMKTNLMTSNAVEIAVSRRLHSRSGSTSALGIQSDQGPGSPADRVEGGFATKGFELGG